MSLAEKQQVHENESGSFNDGIDHSDAEAHRRLLKKIDYRLIPFLSVLYLLSFLDRVNIGQAKLDTLVQDLNLVGNTYNIALVVFFVGYVAFEVPSNVILKRARPSRYIPTVMVLWGIIMTLMGTVQSYSTLVVARFFLGLAESPLFPGICFYLTMWYKRDESNFRIAIFFSSATLSGAFGGLLAYGLSQMAGVGGYAGWRWIFIIEGLLTFVVAVASYWMIDDFPEDSKFLTPTEKALHVRKLQEDQGASGEAPFAWAHLWAGLSDWRAYVMALIYIGIAEPLYSLALFTPTIIASLGTWTRAQSQLLSTPPYFLAFIITLISALYSDKIGNRGYFQIFWLIVTSVGYSILLAINPVQQPGVAYFAVFLCVVGVAPCIASQITWTGNNSGPVYKRAVTMGMMFMTGNSGGIISSLVYYSTDAPTYVRGHGTGLAFALMALVLTAFMTFYYRRENARRDALYGTARSFIPESVDGVIAAEDQAQMERWGLTGKSRDEIIALGDRHPGFRYYP